MAHSRQIKAALKAIHADNPNMTYEAMREHLKEIAEWELSAGRSDLFLPDMRDTYRDQYNELGQHLSDAVASEPLTIDQHRYISEAYRGVIYLILTGIGWIWREFVGFLRLRYDLCI